MAAMSSPGPKSLAWLRLNIPVFAETNAKVRIVKAQERDNRAAVLPRGNVVPMKQERIER